MAQPNMSSLATRQILYRMSGTGSVYDKNLLRVNLNWPRYKHSKLKVKCFQDYAY